MYLGDLIGAPDTVLPPARESACLFTKKKRLGTRMEAQSVPKCEGIEKLELCHIELCHTFGVHFDSVVPQTLSVLNNPRLIHPMHIQQQDCLPAENNRIYIYSKLDFLLNIT